MTSTREHVRDIRFGAALGEAFGDHRYGLRLLRRSPGFAAAAVLTLATGATATIFSLVDAVLIQPPPFPEPDRLVTLWQTDPENGDQPVAVAPATFLDWRAQARSFEHVAAIEPYSLDFTGDAEPEVFYASLVTEGFFEALGAGAAHGRTFLPEEFRPGSGVAILAHGFWERRFGGDAGILGRALTLDEQPYTVVGVLAPDFELGLERGRGDRDLYLPKAIAEYETHIRGGGWWHVIARVRPEVALAEAQAEMDAIASRLAVDHPRTNAGIGAQVVPLGGGSARLLRQLLTESMVIAVLGGLGGLVLAAAAIESIPALLPSDVPGLERVALNGRLLGFAVGLVVATALLFGFAPARQVLRRNAADLLGSGRRVGLGMAQGARRVLVPAEVVLALVLLCNASLFVQSFALLVRVDLGFAPRNTVALQVFLDSRTASAARVNFYRHTLGEIRALPGIVAAGAVSSFPLGLANLTVESPLTLHDRPPAPPGEELFTAISLATPGYVDAMRLSLRSGCWFDERDDAAGPPVAVINETLARRHWPDTDPLTRRLTVEPSGRAFEAEVVGVVGAMRPGGFDAPPRAEVYVPHAQGGVGGLTYDGGMTYVVRTARDPGASIPAIQDAVWAIDPLQTLLQRCDRRATAVGYAGGPAVHYDPPVVFRLGGTGAGRHRHHGVIAVATAQRTREMGLRLAMGAEPRDVVRMVVGGAVGLAGAGVVIGLLATLFASRVLVSLLFDVSPTDLATLAGVSLLLLLVAAGAAYLPARRAARVDPLVALRME